MSGRKWHGWHTGNSHCKGYSWDGNETSLKEAWKKVKSQDPYDSSAGKRAASGRRRNWKSMKGDQKNRSTGSQQEPMGDFSNRKTELLGWNPRMHCEEEQERRQGDQLLGHCHVPGEKLGGLGRCLHIYQLWSKQTVHSLFKDTRYTFASYLK